MRRPPLAARPVKSLVQLLLASTALIGLAGTAGAQTLPTGGTTVAGGVAISTPSSTQMTIQQSTSQAIVNWQGFSIGQGATVDIQQPDAQSVLLNRVVGSATSTLAGQLNANGQVFLINPNGIAISKTGQVSAAGFVASTLDIADADFLAGKLDFTGGGASATVSNHGAVMIGRGGYAALIGGRVDNTGSIAVPLGRVGLGAGERATLDLSGDGFLQVAVPSAAQQAEPLIVQSGYVSADGGLVALQAAGVRDAARKTVNLDGVIEARTVSGRPGAVILSGGNGAVTVSGAIDVSARDGGKGGSVTITSQQLTLTGAAIDASGRDGGGDVRIGGDKQGQGPLANASRVTVDGDTTITADALEHGDGGRVIVWSDQRTDFAGKISARGGALGGDGGFTEVSGKAQLRYVGSVDLRAPNGKTGDLLLDPYNLTISNAADTGGFSAAGDDSVINVDTLQDALATANVTVSTGAGGTQAGDITVAAPITWSANTLTLNAYRGIAVNAMMVASGTANLSLVYNNGGSGGQVTYAFGAAANFLGAQGAQSLTINGQAYTLVYDAAQLQAITQTGLTGRYALARSFDAIATRDAGWGPYGFVPIGTVGGVIQNGGNGFTGTFDGLGNIISNLTAFPVPFHYGGLFGYVGAGGVVRNVGLSDVRVSTSNYAGALIGYNAGTLQNSWASGNVSGTGSVGGLVGVNWTGGLISQSFSLVAVTARDSNFVGGLVGQNRGSIADTYAAGAVLGGSYIGGLVGDNFGGSIVRSYAANSVIGGSATSNLGPFVGIDRFGGTVTDTLYDTTRNGYAGGLTTAQFQNGGGALTTLGPAFAGGDNGLYPYLKSFFPNGAQAVSGIAYQDQGVTPLASAKLAPIYSKNPAFVDLTVTGSYWGRVSTDRNGYFYFLVPAGAIQAGDAAAVYTNASTGQDSPGTTNAFHLFTATGATSQGGIDLYGGARTFSTSALRYSQTSIDATALALAIGGNPAAQAAYDGAPNLRILATGASYSIDAPIAVAASSATVIETVTAGSTLTVDEALSVGATGTLVLTSVGTLKTNKAITTQAKANVRLNAGTLLSIDAPITVFGGDQQGWTGSYFISLNSSSLTLNSAGALRINAPVISQGSNALTLNYGGAATNFTFAQGGRVTLINANGSPIDSYAYGGRSITINGEDYTFIRTLADLQGMNGQSGKYALVTSFGGGGASTFVDSFAGTFNGLGNNLNGLTLSGAGSNVGIFGTLSGTVLNLGINGGGVTGTSPTAQNVGALAGTLTGQVYNVWSTADVTTTGAGANTGGLAGTSSGSIYNSYTAGAVRAAAGNAGGIVGQSNGYLYDVLAMGWVLNPTGLAGGVAGYNAGEVHRALAAGYVLSGDAGAGVVGDNTGVLDQVYYDSQTTGLTGYGDGRTTTQLQNGGLPGGFNTGAWSGGIGGKYAYLTSFFPNGIDVVSGTARKADGSPWQAMISLAANGGLVARAGSGANGYYYAFGAPGTLSNGLGVAAYTADGADALNFRVGPRTDLTTGLDLTESWRRDNADLLSSVSAMNTVFASTAGSLTNGLSIANREISTNTAVFSIDQALSVTGTLALKASGAVNQSAPITAGALLVQSPGAFTLTHAGNAIGAVAGVASSLSLTNNASLTVASVGDASGATVNGVTTTGDVKLVATGDLTIAAGATVTGANPVLSASQAFRNLRGADAVTALSGRWLVYAASHTGNTFGDLDSQNTAIFGGTLASRAPGAVAQTGNRYIFANTPTLTVAGKDATKIYGETTSLGGTPSQWAQLVGAPGVTGVFQAQTIDTLFPNLAVTSTGSAATADVGSGYTLDVVPASLVQDYGYIINVTPGSLAVTPRAITVTADALSRIYGEANPALTYAIGGLGLVNGDSLTGALSTTATTASGVGLYGIIQGDLAASTNYDLTYNDANLDITPRAITVTANALSRIYGETNPALTYGVGGLGLVNGDSLTGALSTTAITASGVGLYGIGQGSLAVSANYDLTYVGADLDITPRAITVTADALSRIYGEANPALTYGISGPGLVNGDRLTGALSTTATTASGVGLYGIGQGNLAASANYNLTYVGADLDITPRTITVTADALSRIYGEANPALTYGVGGLGLVNGDSLTGALNTTATTTSGVGLYGIGQGSLAVSANYDLTYIDANLDITRRSITITADALSRIYGDANPALAYGISGPGLVNGDRLTGALSTTATTASGVGLYGITQGNLAASANYDLTYINANLDITRRALTVTANALDRIYGEANPALTYAVSGLGLVNGDSLTGALNTTATTTSGVGLYGIGQGNLAASANYDLTYIDANLDITRRALTVTANALSRIYGEANPALTYAVGGLGLVNGDSLTGTLSTTATTASGVGLYGITQGDLAASANYDLTYIDADLDITPREITVTADALDRIYGDANPALTYSVGGLGLVNGDSLTGGLSSTATTVSGVGTYGIAQGTLADGNYAISYTGADLTVTPRGLTVTADALNRIYGEANPALTYAVGGLGLVNGDRLTGDLSTTATTASGVGAYGIAQGTLANGNYTISYAGANLTVTPRAITVTADALSRIYGEANPGLTYTVGGLGLINGDGLSGGLATTATTASGVGAYDIARGSLAASNNYDVTYVGGDLTITPRAITVTADALSRIYGAANPALTYAVGGLGLVNGDSLTGGLATTATTASGVGLYGIGQGSLAVSANYDLTYIDADLNITSRAITVTADGLSRIYGEANPALTYGVGGLGLVNGDSLTGALSTTATTASGVGLYGIGQGSLAVSANYDLTYVGADLDITSRAITVTADALSRIYGETNPALTYGVGGLGLVNGDSLTGALSTTATTASGVGLHGITQGDLAASANYDLTYIDANLDITPRSITVTADALTRIYGNANPALTYAVGGLGLVNGDNLAGGLTTSATTTSDVGAYGVVQGTLANGNYAISYTGADLTVTPRAITVTADALSRIYGEANPALTYAVGGLGLVNGDSLAGGLTTTATTASGVGTHGIAQGSLANGNYSISYTGADLTVTPRAITVTADVLSRIYGEANPALTYTVGGLGLVNGDGLSGGLSSTATVASNVGAYGIAQGTLTNGNYSISYTGADLSITPRAVTITADALSRIYGEANPALTYAIGGLGLVNGDRLTGDLSTTATTASGVGAYGVSQGTLAASTNYDLTYVAADLGITPRAIIVTADALSRIYGEANPALTYAIGGLGLVNGDSLAGGLTTGATTASGVGSYGIAQGTLANGNYSISYAGADLTVAPRALTVTADALSRIYGNANPSLTYTVGGLGLVNGDTLTGVLATDATIASSVAAYAIGQGSLTASPNYVVSYRGAILTVTPRAVIVTADNLIRPQGVLNPTLTYVVGGLGLVNGDRFTGALDSDATQGSPAGDYRIIQGDLTLSPNYALTFQGATLSVTATATPAPTPPPQGSASPIQAEFMAHYRKPVLDSRPPAPVTQQGDEVLTQDPRLTGPTVCGGDPETSACTVVAAR